MGLYSYLPIICLFILLFIIFSRQKQIIAKKVIKRRKTEDKTEMIELAKRFIGKKCLIYAFDSSHQYVGTIKEVTDGAMLIENAGKLEAINLEFVIRIREYPTNKKGKEKSIVLD